MFIEVYVEALLVDEDLADQVWEWWNVGFISDDLAAVSWLLLTQWAAAIRQASVQ